MRAALAGCCLLLSAGCQLYRPLDPPAAVPTASRRARFGSLSAEAQSGGGRSAEEWQALLRDEVRAGGWLGDEGPLLSVYAHRRVLPDRLSEVLHLLTIACYPRRATILVRVSAMARHAGGLAGVSTVTVRLRRDSSLGLVFYPPAWGLEPGADLLEEAVRSATRSACARLGLAWERLEHGQEPAEAPGPADEAATRCPACAEPVDPGWIACPRCAAKLGE